MWSVPCGGWWHYLGSCIREDLDQYLSSCDHHQIQGHTAQCPHSGQEEQLWIWTLVCSRSIGDPCPIWFGGPVFTEAFPNFWIPFLQFILGGFVYIWMPRGGRAPLSPFWRIASELEEKIVCVPSIFTTYPLTTHQLYCPPMYSVLPPDDALMDQLGFTAFLWLQMRQLVFWNAAC